MIGCELLYILSTMQYLNGSVFSYLVWFWMLGHAGAALEYYINHEDYV